MKKIFAILTIFLSSGLFQAEAAPLLPAAIIETRPHSTESYTQGLFFLDGRLYESAGLYGRSALTAWNFLAEGPPELWRKFELKPEYFAEGADAAGGEIYLLTWKEQTCLVLDPAGLEIKKSLPYTGEGWGLAWDGQKLWRSDGSAKLYPHQAGDFAPAGEPLTVTDGDKEISLLNELEWDPGTGLMLANIYGEDLVAAIDLADGRVRFWLDARRLRRMAALEGLPKTGNQWDTVLNGLALNADGLWLTGKLWPRMYLVAWPPEGLAEVGGR